MSNVQSPTSNVRFGELAVLKLLSIVQTKKLDFGHPHGHSALLTFFHLLLYAVCVIIYVLCVRSEQWMHFSPGRGGTF